MRCSRDQCGESGCGEDMEQDGTFRSTKVIFPLTRQEGPATDSAVKEPR